MELEALKGGSVFLLRGPPNQFARYSCDSDLYETGLLLLAGEGGCRAD